LCVVFEAKGGGYLKANDTRGSSSLAPTPYEKTKTNKNACYSFDNAPPEHCSKVGSCDFDPLQIDNRITRDGIQTVQFTGWIDPVPTGGLSDTASTIESYEIRVNEVLPSSGLHSVDYTTNVLSNKVNLTTTEMILNLTSDKPRLYCLTLEVKDFADNVRQCRRFLLYDNTSFIESDASMHFQFTSASPDTNFTWQTHHNEVCISWKEYFYNNFYINNPLFNGIESTSNNSFSGTYDQIKGVLPVTGTPNVHGIVRFMVSSSINEGLFTPEKEVSDFINQTYCESLPVQDGDILTFSVRPVDIVGNTYNESRTVYVDRSVPEIMNIWLQKDGFEHVFVHDSTDLSRMSISFDALDQHSGLQKVHWRFGIADIGLELISGHIAVKKVYNVSDI